MTEKESKHLSEQDDFFTKMILTLKTMQQEAETLTQSLELPVEKKYDVLAAMYDQTHFSKIDVEIADSIGQNKKPTKHFTSLFSPKEANIGVEKNNITGSFYTQMQLEENTLKTCNFQFYPYQQRIYTAITSGRNVILHAPTGAGKTYASLLPFIANFVQGGEALPSTCRYIAPKYVLANQLYHEHQLLSKKSEHFLKADAQKSHQQIRSTTITVQTSGQSEDPQMEASLTFCTIDQLLANFLNVPPGRDFEKTNPTVAGILSSYLIFDEFHLYSSHNNHDAFNERMTMLQMLRLFRRTTPFVLLTATSSSALLQRLHSLLDAEIISVTDEQELADIAKGSTRTFWRSEIPMNAEIILAEHYQRPANRCTLVICNTTERAQNLYLQLKLSMPEKSRIILFHSRFTTTDRQRLAREIESELGIDKWHNGSYSGSDLIVVATSVIEVGLNISVQVLHTEIAPANSLIQRAGRCARFAQQQGQVWIHPLPQIGDGKTSDTLPYSQALCATTWKMLESFHAREIGFLQEMELINAVHTQEDEMFMDQYEINESKIREQILTNLNTEDHATSSLLLKDIMQVQILIHDNPSNTIQDSPWQWESFSVPPSMLIAHWQTLQERASQLKLPVCWEPIIQKNEYSEKLNKQEKIVYTWQPVVSNNTIPQSRILAFPRQLARYDSELGFSLLDGQLELGKHDYQSMQLPAHVLNRGAHRSYQLTNQKYKGALLRAYNLYVSKDIHYAATRLEQEMSLEPGAIDKAIRQTIASYNPDHKNQTWQQWSYMAMEILANVQQEDTWDYNTVQLPNYILRKENLHTRNAQRSQYIYKNNINGRKELESWLYFLIGRALQLSNQKAG